jgi:DNA-directed RNA polymerase specialized sigma24 family protein
MGCHASQGVPNAHLTINQILSSLNNPDTREASARHLLDALRALAFGRRMIRKMDVEDIIQRVALKLLERSREPPQTWSHAPAVGYLRRMLTNELADAARAEVRKARMRNLLPEPENTTEWLTTASTTRADGKKLFAKLLEEAASTRLNRHRRQLFTLARGIFQISDSVAPQAHAPPRTHTNGASLRKRRQRLRVEMRKAAERLLQQGAIPPLSG